MNYQEFERAKETFPLHTYEKEFQELETIRRNFVRKFSLRNLANMTIDQFVIGRQNTDSFCYIIERTLDGLGRILGRPSNKFGVWYSPDKGCYSYDSRFGGNANSTFVNVKYSIIKLLKDAEDNNIEELIDNPIDSLFKGKILSTYFPDRFLNIFSVKHLDYYLRFLNLDSKALIKSDAIRKRDALLEFKNNDPDMKDWSINMFAVFLYRHYPKRPLKENEVAVKSKNKDYVFPTIDSVEWVTRGIDSRKSHDTHSHTKPTKDKSPDYEKDAKNHKALGDRGEYIVYCAEIERIENEFKIGRESAEKYIDWKSRKGDDACGYDIQSVNADKSPRYIEVKATQMSVGDTVFYYTENELQQAKTLGDNYCIYIVYDILTPNPKIWNMGNPFKNSLLELQPIKYRVKVKTTKKQ
jgi:hypothetical protein